MASFSLLPPYLRPRVALHCFSSRHTTAQPWRMFRVGILQKHCSAQKDGLHHQKATGSFLKAVYYWAVHLNLILTIFFDAAFCSQSRYTLLIWKNRSCVTFYTILLPRDSPPHVAFEPGLPQSRVQRAPTTAPHCLILVVPKQCVKTGLIVKPCLALILEGLAQVFLVPKAIGKCCSSPCSDQSQPFLFLLLLLEERR